MNHTRLRVTFVGAAMCTLGLFAGESLAQADLQEGFDDNGPTQEGDHGPINLIDQGWIFRNQSEPLGWSHWTDNLLQNDPPHAGASCIGASVWNVNGAGIISNWMILPAVESQQEGDILAFYVDGSQSWPDGLQVRYSPSGGTDTGSGPEDVGDFEELLLDLYVANGDWAQHSLELPGSGRIALRRYLNPGGPQTPFGTYLRIDTLSIAPTEPP